MTDERGMDLSYIVIRLDGDNVLRVFGWCFLGFMALAFIAFLFRLFCKMTGLGD